MLQIKPTINHYSICPYCEINLQNKNILWQGMFVCVESRCENCCKNIFQDLKIGHGNRFNYQLDLADRKIFGDPAAKEWLAKPLLESLNHPQYFSVQISKEILKRHDAVVILNCIDFLYGHCLLKLLNAERHLKKPQGCGLVVIVPKILRWLVPDGVAEIWMVDIPLQKGRSYYPELNKFIQQEVQRFNSVFVSKAYSHPSNFHITNFTRVARHDFSSSSFRVTFIWREDRLWSNLPIPLLGIWQQNYKIFRIFTRIKKDFPKAIFTVVGLGKTTNFPHWIEDARVEEFGISNEQSICNIYRESRLVIGVHGSNMLLPSAHAGMTINLLPQDRMGNFAQDILYQEDNPRLAAFYYRYVSFIASATEVSLLAKSMLDKRAGFIMEMT